MQLTIVRGVPGSGKSTFVRNNFPNTLHLEMDMFFYHNGVYEYSADKIRDAIKWCYNTCENAFKNGMDVVVSNTFVKVLHILSYQGLAIRYNADFKVYRMNGKFENIHNVPKDVLKRMNDTFEDFRGETTINP